MVLKVWCIRMKKLIYSGVFAFVLLCLFALYQAGFLDVGSSVVQTEEQELSLSANGETPAIDTALVDRVAAATLAQQLGTESSPPEAIAESDVDSRSIVEATASMFGVSSMGSSATGRVVPQTEALLSMMQSGNVIQIYVDEGDFVALGDVLLQLDDSFQKAAVAEELAELSRAKAELARLLLPTREEEIQAATAALDSVKARLRRLDESTIPGRLAIAQASLDAAQANRNQVTEGPQAAVVQAAGAELEGAKLYLDQAQRAYDQVSWRNDVGLLPESLNLQNATTQYNAALARISAAQTGATEAEVSGASANVERVEAELSMLESSLPAERAALEADVRIYESRLSLLMVGPLQADIDVANARIEAAEARLASSKAELTNTALRAPFSGTIAMIEPSIGERVREGDPVIRLADLTSWQIETSDLSELDLANIVLGGTARLQFDAIPDLELNGIIKSIRPFGENSEIDTFYKAIILPRELDDRLRWNMTAFVTFDLSQQ